MVLSIRLWPEGTGKANNSENYSGYRLVQFGEFNKKMQSLSIYSRDNSFCRWWQRSTFVGHAN